MRSLQSVLVFVLFLGCASSSKWQWLDSGARDELRLRDVQEIQLALRAYREHHNSYPAGNGLVLARNNSADLSDAGFTAPGGGSGNSYLRVPGREFRCVYTQLENGKSYRLEFELERGFGKLKAGPHTVGPDAFISW